MFNRFNGNVEPFASGATGTNRTIFGDVTQSDDIDDNLNADFKLGWEIVGVNDNPTKQDFNALAFTISNLVAYLYQQGIPVWNTTQEYYVNGYAVGSDGKIYRAKTGTSGTPNQGNDPITDSTNWESLDGKFVNLLNAQTIAGIKTFSSFPITPSSAPTTDYQVANKKFVDDSLASFSGGKLLQSKTVKLTTDFSTSSTSFVDMLTLSFTPVSTTSKLYISVLGGRKNISSGGTTNNAEIRLAKDTTTLDDFRVGSAAYSTNEPYSYFAKTDSVDLTAKTLKVQARSPDGGSATFNLTSSGTINPISLIVQEIEE